MNQKPLGITLGDPAGIGPEIIVKSWRALNNTSTDLVIYGDPGILAKALKMSDQKSSNLIVLDRLEDYVAGRLNVVPIDYSDRAAGIMESIQQSTQAALQGRLSGIVTGPISKSVLYEAGFTFPGHTEYLADICSRHIGETVSSIMMLMNAHLKAIPVTVHIPLKDVPARLTTDTIITAGRIVAESLKRDFAIPTPVLAVAGLNPHAGEQGHIGQEDIQIIQPAIEQLISEGYQVTGPLPADTMFHQDARQTYDAALCMYHDQALVPVKTLDFHGGVNVTLGLPIIRTSPDHGTAFDIAGQNIARPDSMIQAIKVANQMASHRASCSNED